MKIAISTKNNKKIDVLKHLLSDFKLNDYELIIEEVNSNVPDSPYDNDVGLGAQNRVNNLKNIIDADVYIGLETGLVHDFGYLFIKTWCCIYYRNEHHWGSSSAVQVPRHLEYEIDNKSHQELCDYINIKHSKEDFISYFTDQYMNRETEFMEALRNALLIAGIKPKY